MTASLAKVLRVSSDSFEEAVDAAVRVLLRGGIVALPTDTIYGISTLLEHSEKLYQLKRRPQTKPLGLFLPSVAHLPRYSQLTIPGSVAQQLLPGPVTLIFERNQNLPEFFNPGVHNVGCRVPDSALVQSICAKIDQPLAQTSANISGSPLNPLCVEDFEELWPEIDLVLDGGEIPQKSSAGSTIVDLSQPGTYHIVRDGCAKTKTEEILVRAGLEHLMKRSCDRDEDEPCSSAKVPAPRRAATSSEKPVTDFVNEEELMRSLHFSVTKTADDVLSSISQEHSGTDLKFDDDVLSKVTSLVWDTVAEDWTSDLVGFSAHAGRVAANADDALLLMRRNPNLQSLVKELAGVSSGQPKTRAVKKPRLSVAPKKQTSNGSDAPSSLTSTPQTTKKMAGLLIRSTDEPVATPVSSKVDEGRSLGQKESNKIEKDSFADGYDSFDEDVIWADDEPQTSVAKTPVGSIRIGGRKSIEVENTKPSTPLPETISLDDSFDDDCFVANSPKPPKSSQKTTDQKKLPDNKTLPSPAPKTSIGSMLSVRNTADDDFSDFSDFD